VTVGQLSRGRARPGSRAWSLPRLAAALVAAAVIARAHDSARAQTAAQPFDPHRPLIIRSQSEPKGASAHEVKPLDPVEMATVQDAARTREVGQYDLARKKLASLSAAAQHHPIVLTERARIELDAGNPTGAYTLAVAERRVQKDSLLLGHELVEACERLNRMREASLTAVEVWSVAPAEEAWAMSVITRLCHLDGHASRDALRKAFAREPRRADLARGLAYVEWAAGDLPSALKALRSVEPLDRGPRYRWAFAEVLLQSGTQHDSTGAVEVYADVASDTGLEAGYRMTAARRGFDLANTRGQQNAMAPRLYQALKDVPRDRWVGDFAVTLARALRLAGDTGAARALIGTGTPGATTPPEMALERSLADLRDGPPERVVDAMRPADEASDEAVFHYAEALFFAGQPDSALAWYQKVAANPGGPFTGAALERIFLIEDGSPRSALPTLGRIAYEQWRGTDKRALALAESLWTTLPHGPLWAQTGLIVSQEREKSTDVHGALAAALAVADSLPDDRLAPAARQRAGDLYSMRLKDDVHAIEQYEACVAKYPRAWNAPEVRRRLEDLRRTRRP